MMRIAWIAAILFLTSCRKRPDDSPASYTPMAALQAKFGSLITTGNHPTPDQNGTGDRVGFFRQADGTVWGLPLTITTEGAVVGCAPATLQSANVTDTYPAASTIVGTTNEPTGWRGGTGKLELVLRNPDGTIKVQPVSGEKLPQGPSCWAQLPPGPPQQLSYYRLAPTK